MLRNIIGPILTYKNLFFLGCCFACFFFQKSSSFCRENEICEDKKNQKTKKLGPVVNI